MGEINVGTAFVEIAAKTDRLKSDLSKIKTDSETTARKIEQDFQKAKVTFDNRLMKMSLADVEKEAARLRAMLEKKIEVNASYGTLEALKQRIETAENALLRFKKVSGDTPAVMHRMATGTNQMNQAMGQLGFMIGDADMFMMNFRMGMMSIANNVPMVVQGLMYAKEAAQKTGQSFKSALVGSLMGPGGVMLAINALMFALNVLPRLFEDSDKAVEEHKEKLKSLREEYSKLTREQITNYLSELDKQLAELEKKYPAQKTQTITKVVGGNAVSESVTVGVKGGDRFSGEWGTVQDIQNRQAALKETLRDLGVIEDIGNRLTLNQEKLNKLNRDPASPFYFQNIVKTAKSYEEAKAVVEQWIKADEERSKKKGGAGGGKSEIERLLEEEQNYKKELADIDAALKQTNLSEFARNELLAKRADLLEKIHKWDNYNAARNGGLGGIKANGLETMPTGNGTMPQIDSETVRKQKEQSDAGFKNTLKEDKTLADELAYSYQSMGEALISSWSQSVTVFKEANSMLQQFINGLVQATTQTLALKVAQKGVSLLLNGPLSFLGLGGHDGGAFTNGVKLAGGGGFMVPPGFPNDTFPLNVQSNELVKVYTPNQQQANLRDYAALLAGINNVNASVNRMVNSLQAMNVNIVSQPTPTTRVYLDGKDITKNVLSNQKKFGKGGVNVD